MIIKEYPINDFSLNNHRKEFSIQKYNYLDIETTGLSREKNQIILITLGFFRENQFLCKQYFAENPREERDILLEFSKDINPKEKYISYNGKVFDIPFINSAFQRHRIPCQLSESHHWDMLVFLRPLKKIWGMDSLRLKEVEKFFEIHREDTISGKDSVLLYKEYVKTRNPVYLRNILLHNFEDVKNLLILHGLLVEKMHQEKTTILLPEGHIDTILYDYSLKNNKGSFLFHNLYSNTYLNYYYDNGEDLQINRENCQLNVFLKQIVNQSGQIVHFTLQGNQPLPLFSNNQLLRENLFLLLKGKIQEVFV